MRYIASSIYTDAGETHVKCDFDLDPETGVISVIRVYTQVNDTVKSFMKTNRKRIRKLTKDDKLTIVHGMKITNGSFKKNQIEITPHLCNCYPNKYIDRIHTLCLVYLNNKAVLMEQSILVDMILNRSSKVDVR